MAGTHALAGSRRRKTPVVLTIAGHDPSSGAGITADIKTIAAHACYGLSCVTALTVQSTKGVRRVEPVDGEFIAQTLERLADDVNIAAVKIGMTGSAEAVEAVVAFLKGHRLKYVVLDPIFRSSSGTELISTKGLQILKEKLIPLALVITPNIDEAAVLSGERVADVGGMKAAAERLHESGAANVIVTGGHLDPPCDLVRCADGGFILLKGRKVETRSTHGTGCAFSTALACELALGHDLVTAARAAKRFVALQLRRAPMIGRGIGPVV